MSRKDWIYLTIIFGMLLEEFGVGRYVIDVLF